MEIIPPLKNLITHNAPAFPLELPERERERGRGMLRDTNVFTYLTSQDH